MRGLLEGAAVGLVIAAGLGLVTLALAVAVVILHTFILGP
jgi:hypothetical protein